MTSPASYCGIGARGHRVSTLWLASVLVAASTVELVILRIGTRTAIHVPGIEQVRGPYRVIAAGGRLAFFVAVVASGVLLVRLTRDLRGLGRARSAASLSSFIGVAVIGALRLVGNDLLAPAVTAIVASLAIVVLARQRREIAAVVGLFAAAFVASAVPTMVQAGSGGGLGDGSRQLLSAAELLAVLAAVVSGPLVRRWLGLDRFPPSRLASIASTAGVIVTVAILVDSSTAHILMLWNFGLTGALPAPAYGLAVASLIVAVHSCARDGRRDLALALTLLLLGGIGLTSTYQSGLVVAGLGLIDLTPDPARAFVVSDRDKATIRT